MHLIDQRELVAVFPAAELPLGQFDHSVGITVNLRWGENLVEQFTLSLPLLAFGREDVLTEGDPEILVLSERIPIAYEGSFEVIRMCEYVKFTDSKHLHPEGAAVLFDQVADECQRVTRELERLTEYRWPGCRWWLP
jgi:hypothetical protein